ncbi:MAG: rhodanese-like domain-containing protein [Deltaproteobacteria bacterium]
MILPILAAALVATAPHPAKASAKADEGFRLIQPAELAAQLQSAARPLVFDANHADFRAKNGIIPGAKLLSSPTDYDVSRELPKDKGAKLVFYCAGKL